MSVFDESRKSSVEKVKGLPIRVLDGQVASLALWAVKVWDVPAFRLESATVVVPAWTGVQVPEPPL